MTDLYFPIAPRESGIYYIDVAGEDIYLIVGGRIVGDERQYPRIEIWKLNTVECKLIKEVDKIIDGIDFISVEKSKYFVRNPSMPCPICGGLLVRKDGRYGPFYGCKNYPDCKGSVSIHQYEYYKPETGLVSVPPPADNILTSKLDEIF